MIAAFAVLADQGEALQRAAAGDEQKAKAVVRSGLPDASAKLTTADNGAILTIALPHSRVGRAPNDDSEDAVYDFIHAGWLAGVPASAATVQIPSLTELQVTLADGVVPRAARNWHKTLRTSPGEDASRTLKKLDSVSESQALAQANENLAVLRAGLPEGSIVQASVASMHADNQGRTAVLIDVAVSDLANLRDHYGNLLEGLSTGLTGGVDSVIEGLAVRISDRSGHKLGSWAVPRIGSGTLFLDRRLGDASSRTVTLPFVSRTGGPRLLGAGTGGGGSAVVLPRMRISSGTEAATFRAIRTDCGQPRCAGSAPSNFKDPFLISKNGKLRLRPYNAATSIEVAAHDETGAAIGRPRRALRSGHSNWTVTLPRTRVTTVQIVVDYRKQPDALFAIRTDRPGKSS